MSVLAPAVLCLMTGCASTGGFTPPWKKAEAKVEVPRDGISLMGGRTYDLEPIDPKLRQELDAAQRLMQDKKYADAESLYHKLTLPGVAPGWWSSLNPFETKDEVDVSGITVVYGDGAAAKKKSKYPRAVYEEALFGEAECQRVQKNYREAVDTYTKLLVQFPSTKFTNRSCQGLFEIADHWLEPTRRQMDEYQEQLAGKRWMVTPALYLHFNKEMPMLDAEGHATQILNTIRLHDIKGDMGKKALLYLGTINFYRQEYKEADFYFTQIFEHYKDSPEAPKAIKQSVICKQLMTGGSVYDLRTVEKSKELLMMAQGAYPEFAQDQAWVETQLKSMNIQQADRDFKIAEFYQRTGHPGSAYFYYELVCRRYPGTNYATQALQRKNELKGKADREQREQTGSPPSVQGPANPQVQNPPVPPFATPPPRTLPPGVDSRDR
jgi:outer membrane protein assembly factor BamD (BamD/ComL family)